MGNCHRSFKATSREYVFSDGLLSQKLISVCRYHIPLKTPAFIFTIIIAGVLNQDEKVIEGSANVVFKEVRSSDYNIFIYCYINIVDYAVFLAEKERINYTIMDILQKNNIDMAYDTQTIEIKK